MESMPMRLLRRELGWNYQHKSDYKKLLCSLHNREEDRISLFQPNLYLDGSDDNPIYALEFGPKSSWLNIVAAADETGFLTLVNTHEGVKAKDKIVNRQYCHTNALSCLNWSQQKAGLIVTGSADQSIRVWDVGKHFDLLRIYRKHTRTVKAVRFHPSHPDIMASGSRDGSIMVWDNRTPGEDPENFITSAHTCQHQSKKKPIVDGDIPISDLVFKDDNTLISCGSSDGFIKFWDIRKTYKYLKRKEPVRKIPYPLKDTLCVGYSSFCMDELNNLYAASASTEVFKFNLSLDSDAPESYFINNANMQYCVKLDVSRDGRFLIAGSTNSYAHIWDTWDCDAKDPFSYLEGQTLDSTLGCVAFNPQDPLTVVTGGDDSALVIWRVNNLKSHYKKCGGSNAIESLPRAPLESLRIKQQQNLQTFIPLYRRSQVTQVVGTWTSKSPSKSPRKITPTKNTTRVPVSTTFNLCSLLSDLPNFVIDGRMCHIPERAHSAISRKHTWLGDFGTTEREKRPSPSTLKETPPKRLKRTTNSNSTNASSNLCTPPRKTTRFSMKSGSGGKRNKGEVMSPGTQPSPQSLTSPSILKYFTAPLRTSNLSVPEY